MSRARPRRSALPLGTAVAAALLAAAGLAPAAASAGAPAVDAATARARWQGRLDGRHFSATVTLTLDRGGSREERRVEVWRDDLGARRERLLARFTQPADLRGVALLYLERADGPNDYFAYQPALRRVRRIAESVVREDVYGVDLEYLGFGVAPLVPTDLVALDAAPLDDHPALRLRERATAPGPRFDERTVWLDPRTWVPLRTEHARGGRTVLVARTQEVRDVQGVPTPMRIAFERPGETVTMRVLRIDYEAPIPDAFFSTGVLLK